MAGHLRTGNTNGGKGSSHFDEIDVSDEILIREEVDHANALCRSDLFSRGRFLLLARRVALERPLAFIFESLRPKSVGKAREFETADFMRGTAFRLVSFTLLR